MKTEHNDMDDGYRLPPLIKGRLIQRYKRFLADVALETGERVTAHCPNSGSMKGCAEPGWDVWLSASNNPRRKLPYTWELVRAPETLIGINTQVPNKLVRHSIENGRIQELSGYERVRPEIKTSGNTRLDLLLEGKRGDLCYVEVKNCTLVEDGMAMFPDAVTTRGQKHLEELAELVSQGHRGVIFFLIQRMDAVSFRAAHEIDKDYARKLTEVANKGVEIVTRDTIIDMERIRIGRRVAWELET